MNDHVISEAGIALIAGRCLIARSQKSSCRICVEICSQQALAIKNGSITIDAESCTHCGACVTVCPESAFTDTVFSEERLERTCLEMASADDGQLVIACNKLLSAGGTGQVFQDRDACPVPLTDSRFATVDCLDLLDESLLVRLIAGGVTSITLCHGECLGCEIGTGSAVCSLVAETSNYLLSAWGNSPCIVFQDELPERIVKENPEGGARHSRRDLFAQLHDIALATFREGATPFPSEQSSSASKRKILKVNENGLLPKFAGNRQERLLAALKSFGSPSESRVNSRFWGKLTIDTSNCSHCALCAAVCPSHALTRKKDAPLDSFTLEFTASACSQCKLCEDVCEPAALTVQSEVLTFALVRSAIETFKMLSTG